MKTSTEYWSEHMVTTEHFRTREDSIAHLNWRNSQYIDYHRLMPVNIYNTKTVLDYGCGPGNDLVGIMEASKPTRLIGMDVSLTALGLAKQRLSLHEGNQGITNIDIIHVEENENRIPLENNSVDHIHCSGVLHHCKHPDKVLKEFHRVLKLGGTANIMVYNYLSIFVHLYTAWIQPALNNKFVGDSLQDAFRKNTDGEGCPISRYYSPDEFLQFGRQFGFDAHFTGAAISIFEMKVLKYRFHAIADRDLAQMHRDFLLELEFDNRQIPYINNQVAGIDGCYQFTKTVD